MNKYEMLVNKVQICRNEINCRVGQMHQTSSCLCYEKRPLLQLVSNGNEQGWKMASALSLCQLSKILISYIYITTNASFFSHSETDNLAAKVLGCFSGQNGFSCFTVISFNSPFSSDKRHARQCSLSKCCLRFLSW